jgi:hypothetical protein
MILTNNKIYNYANQLLGAFSDSTQRLPARLNFIIHKNKQICLDCKVNHFFVNTQNLDHILLFSVAFVGKSVVLEQLFVGKSVVLEQLFVKKNVKCLVNWFNLYR